MPKKNQNKNRKPQPKRSTANKIITTIGGALGGLVGAKDLGVSAGDWVSKAFGLGSYTVKSNAFTLSPDSVPEFKYSTDGSVIVTHREMITDVIGAAAFTSYLFDIDPTSRITFPWLSNLAPNYEQYEFLGLLFVYKPTSGDAIASTNNALGTVVIATEYDVSRPTFVTKQEMESYEFCTSSKPSLPMIHPVECAPTEDIIKARYTRGVYRTQRASTSVTPESINSPDVAENLNFLGRTQLSVVGMQAATTVGELWVTYRVKLSKPRALPPGAPISYFSAYGSLQSGQDLFQNYAISNTSTSGANFIYMDSTHIYFPLAPKGSVVTVIYTASGTGTSPTLAMTLPSQAGLTVYNSLPISTAGAYTYSAYSGNATANVTQIQTWTIDDSNAVKLPVLTYADPTIGGSGVDFYWNLIVYLRPANSLIAPLLSSGERLETLVSDVNRLKLQTILELDEKSPN